VKFNSEILQKSGNLWKYSNGNNFNPCQNGWSVDYSGLKCSKSTEKTECLPINNSGATDAKIRTKADSDSWSFAVYLHHSHTGQYVYWKGKYIGQTSHWRTTNMNHGGFRYYRTTSWASGSTSNGYFGPICRKGPVTTFKNFSDI
jgi:hypothetical protein